jgi:hypothetical protein
VKVLLAVAVRSSRRFRAVKSELLAGLAQERIVARNSWSRNPDLGHGAQIRVDGIFISATRFPNFFIAGIKISKIE